MANLKPALAALLLLPAAALASSSSSPECGGVHTEAIDGEVESLCYHLRVAAGNASESRFALYWNYLGPDSHDRLEMTLSAASEADFDHAATARYRLVARREGRDVCRDSGAVACRYGDDAAVSAVLNADGDSGAHIEIGATGAEKRVTVDFDSRNPHAVGYGAPQGGRVLRSSLRLVARETRSKPRYADADSLSAHLAASTDGAEGLWSYLDKDMPAMKARMGERYSLATVRRARGEGYEIVALGADGTPSEIKGVLKPTIFADHYDLEWYDAAGRRLRDEAFARITLQGSVLELNFPVSGAKVRFRRHAGRR